MRFFDTPNKNNSVKNTTPNLQRNNNQPHTKGRKNKTHKSKININVSDYDSASNKHYDLKISNNRTLGNELFSHDTSPTYNLPPQSNEVLYSIKKTTGQAVVNNINDSYNRGVNSYDIHFDNTNIIGTASPRVKKHKQKSPIFFNNILKKTTLHTESMFVIIMLVVLSYMLYWLFINVPVQSTPHNINNKRNTLVNNIKIQHIATQYKTICPNNLLSKHLKICLNQLRSLQRPTLFCRQFFAGISLNEGYDYIDDVDQYCPVGLTPTYLPDPTLTFNYNDVRRHIDFMCVLNTSYPTNIDISIFNQSELEIKYTDDLGGVLKNYIHQTRCEIHNLYNIVCEGWITNGLQNKSRSFWTASRLSKYQYTKIINHLFLGGDNVFLDQIIKNSTLGPKTSPASPNIDTNIFKPLLKNCVDGKTGKDNVGWNHYVYLLKSISIYIMGSKDYSDIGYLIGMLSAIDINIILGPKITKSSNSISNVQIFLSSFTKSPILKNHNDSDRILDIKSVLCQLISVEDTIFDTDENHNIHSYNVLSTKNTTRYDNIKTRTVFNNCKKAFVKISNVVSNNNARFTKNFNLTTHEFLKTIDITNWHTSPYYRIQTIDYFIAEEHLRHKISTSSEGNSFSSQDLFIKGYISGFIKMVCPDYIFSETYENAIKDSGLDIFFSDIQKLLLSRYNFRNTRNDHESTCDSIFKNNQEIPLLIWNDISSILTEYLQSDHNIIDEFTKQEWDYIIKIHVVYKMFYFFPQEFYNIHFNILYHTGLNNNISKYYTLNTPNPNEYKTKNSYDSLLIYPNNNIHLNKISPWYYDYNENTYDFTEHNYNHVFENYISMYNNILDIINTDNINNSINHLIRTTPIYPKCINYLTSRYNNYFDIIYTNILLDTNTKTSKLKNVTINIVNEAVKEIYYSHILSIRSKNTLEKKIENILVRFGSTYTAFTCGHNDNEKLSNDSIPEYIKYSNEIIKRYHKFTKNNHILEYYDAENLTHGYKLNTSDILTSDVLYLDAHIIALSNIGSINDIKWYQKNTCQYFETGPGIHENYNYTNTQLKRMCDISDPRNSKFLITDTIPSVFYNFRENSISITSATFNTPYYDTKMDNLSLYASLGHILSTQIAESISVENIMYDFRGVLNDTHINNIELEKIKTIRDMLLDPYIDFKNTEFSSTEIVSNIFGFLFAFRAYIFETYGRSDEGYIKNFVSKNYSRVLEFFTIYLQMWCHTENSACGISKSKSFVYKDNETGPDIHIYDVPLLYIMARYATPVNVNIDKITTKDDNNIFTKTQTNFLMI